MNLHSGEVFQSATPHTTQHTTTHHHIPHTPPHATPQHTHNTHHNTHHTNTEQHTTTHGDRQTQTDRQTETENKRRQDEEREKARRKTREEKTEDEKRREEKKQDESNRRDTIVVVLFFLYCSKLPDPRIFRIFLITSTNPECISSFPGIFLFVRLRIKLFSRINMVIILAPMVNVFANPLSTLEPSQTPCRGIDQFAAPSAAGEVPVLRSTGAPVARAEERVRSTLPTPTLARRPTTMSSSVFVDIPPSSMDGKQRMQKSELHLDKFPLPQSFVGR